MKFAPAFAGAVVLINPVFIRAYKSDLCTY